MSSKAIRARARYGVAVRIGTPEQQEEARRDLAVANIEQYIERVVAEAPPLTSEQRDRLTAVIRGGDA